MARKRTDGFERLAQRLARLPAAIRKEMGPAVIAQAKEVASVAEMLAPRQSGDLAASIEVTGPGERTPPYSQPGGSQVVPDGAAAVTVGNTKVRYGHLVEYGTSEANAQPFFWPAVRLTSRKLRARGRAAMSRAIKKTGFK